MTKREFLRHEVLKLVQQSLEQYGFTLNKRDSEFTKRNEDGWTRFYLNFLLRSEGWEINPTMLIRFNIVEDLFHKTSGFELKYQKGTPTIGSSIENYLHTGYDTYRFYLKEEEEIDDIACQIIEAFKDCALPFYEKFNNLSAIESKLNKIPIDSSLTGAIFIGYKGIILAKILARPHYKDFRTTYLKYYEQFSNGFYLQPYLELIDYLDNEALI